MISVSRLRATRASPRQDGDGRTADAPRASPASDIVELVVLTTDEVFLQTLRDALGPSRRLWHVLSPDKLSDLLLAGDVGILVLDVQALLQQSSLFISQIQRQFPDLVMVVAGARESEPELARLISEGTVYRFIHKPVSPGRAQLFADAAVKRYGEQRKHAPRRPDGPVSPGRNGLLLITGACAAICAVGGVLYTLGRDESAPAPASSTTLPPSAFPATAGPAAASPAAQQAEGQRTGPPTEKHSGGLPLLSADRVKSGAPARSADRPTTGAAATGPDSRPPAASAAASSDPAEPLAALAMQRIRDGHLVDPEGDDARMYVQQALAANPDSDAAEQASEALALGLLSAAHGAIDRGEFQAAAHWLDVADGIAAPANLENLRRLMAAAESRADQGGAPAGPVPPPPAAEQIGGSDDGRAPPPARGALPVESSVRLRLVKSVQPEYPQAARAASIEGWVELDFTVTASGEVKDISVHAASPRGVFDRAAIAALSQWRYEPVSGAPALVARRARIRIRFALAR